MIHEKGVKRVMMGMLLLQVLLKLLQEEIMIL